MAEPIQSGAVYRITSRASNNLRLELGDGDTRNGTQAQGWHEMTDISFYNQQWLVEDTGDHVNWTLRNLRSGTYLDLSNGGSDNGTKLQGWGGVDNDNRKWTISQLGPYWAIRNKGTQTAVDLADGGKNDGTRVWGWQYIPNDNQKWLFKRMTRTPQEIQALLGANVRVGRVEFPHYQDMNYLVLPLNLQNIIYNDSGIKRNFRWRPEIFDCDDFAVTFKAAVAKHGYDSILVDNIAILCGIMFGSKPPNLGHALNWSVSETLNSINFLEPQNGQWNADAFGWQAYFGMF